MVGSFEFLISHDLETHLIRSFYPPPPPKREKLCMNSLKVDYGTKKSLLVISCHPNHENGFGHYNNGIVIVK